MTATQNMIQKVFTQHSKRLPATSTTITATWTLKEILKRRLVSPTERFEGVGLAIESWSITLQKKKKICVPLYIIYLVAFLFKCLFEVVLTFLILLLLLMFYFIFLYYKLLLL